MSFKLFSRNIFNEETFSEEGTNEEIKHQFMGSFE